MGKKKVVQKGITDLEKEEKKLSEAFSLGSKKKLQLERGRIYIKASYNNTILTVTDSKGNVITWASAGSLGFSGPKKATPFASSKVVEVIAERLRSTGPKEIEILVSGIGSGRDAALRALATCGFDIISIKDITPIPHNGPRPPKPRRV